jgi:flavodoxin I
MIKEKIMKAVVVYGSTMGNCSDVAERVSSFIEGSEVCEVGSFDFDTVADYDLLLFGSSTWGLGDLQDDWEEKIDDLKGADLSGKKVALFGTGDQESYVDTFADAVGILYEAVVEAGAEVIGLTSTDDYSFDESRAVVDGKFIGLILDEDNESEKSDERISAWVSSLEL